MQFYPLIDERPSCVSVTDFVMEYADFFVAEPGEADAFFVGGGDGWMLDMMRKRYHLDKPFLGVNCGTRGFLLNSFDEEKLCMTCLENIELIDVWAVDATIWDVHGGQEQGFFFNDIALGGSVLDYFTIDVQSSDKDISTQGTGLVVCSSLGSTGYALNLGQPMLPLQSNMWGVSGIATFPFHYTFVQPQELTISLKGKVSVQAGLDGYHATHTDIQKIVLRPSQKKAQLAFFKEQAFEEKRLLLAEEKLGR